MNIQASTLTLAFGLALAGSAVHAGSPTLSDFTAINGNFNRSTDLSTAIDNSRTAADSFNRTTTVTTSTDNSRKAQDSFNRYSSVSTSLNLKSQTVNPTVSTWTNQTTLDTQSQSSDGKAIGGTTYASQGGFTMGSVGSGSSYDIGGGKNSRVNQNMTLSNYASIGGPNSGSVANTNVAALNGDANTGISKSIVGSRLGNDMSVIAGNTSLNQSNGQTKQSATSSASSTSTPTTVNGP
jgi:hypothetical protein